MEVLTNIGSAFGDVVRAMGNELLGLVTGVVPGLMALMTVFFFIQKAIGEERVKGFIQKLCKFSIIRWTFAPMVAAILFSVPMDFVAGSFLKEEHKISWFEGVLSLHHPLLGLFQHVHAPEYFVYMGIASGLLKLGYNLGGYNIRILLAGLVVAAIRGFTSERIFSFMKKGREKKLADA